jgi:uncharacterized protein (TIGR02145 family)
MNKIAMMFLLLLAGTVYTRAQTVHDVDGNSYPVIVIGTQVWMAENLKTTRYSDGTPIPMVSDSSGWASLTSPSFCWYGNDPVSCAAKYGALYNWYATNPKGNGNRNLCPEGWRVPTDEDWTILAQYLADNGYGFEGERRDIAKALSAASGWKPHNIVSSPGNDQESNNRSGFNAVPAGYRNFLGAFNYAGSYTYWWSSSEQSPEKAFYRFIHSYYSYLGRNSFSKKNGFSIRCVCEKPAENKP